MFPETVADKLSDAVIEQAMKLSAEDRQELVVSYIAKANEIWMVQGSEGFVMFEGAESVQLPVFPHHDLAQKFVDINEIEEYQHHKKDVEVQKGIFFYLSKNPCPTPK